MVDSEDGSTPDLPRALSQRARLILGLIADGHSFEQILATHADLKYQDIFDAARDALACAAEPPDRRDDWLLIIRKRHPRAYERWTPQEEARLAELYRAGEMLSPLAETLERQPGAIRSRLEKLGLRERQLGLDATG